ncbi:MAG TPA: SDR family NAD(P)-dependent oxidoreductase [Jatrophihabitantaceae bacterium]|jgi:NAD(P)-dependent dehydrogenase (short-subunit alcohol dehydrogenase family)
MASAGRRLDGRVALVTGASRGLGHDIALGLAAEGAAVAVAARTLTPGPGLPGSLQQTVSEIRAGGGVADAFACDVQVDAELIAVVDGARERLGPVDILVNNAALTVPGRPGAPPPSLPKGGTAPTPGFLDIPLKAYRRSFEVGLFPLFRLSQLVLPDMLAAGRGSIINIGSDSARKPGEGPWSHTGQWMLYGYGGSKLAVEHLSHSLAYELSGTGVTVNALLTSRPLDSPGLRHMTPGYVGNPTASFVEAAIRLASGATGLTGRSIYHEDLLHDGPPRGWQGGLGPTAE